MVDVTTIYDQSFQCIWRECVPCYTDDHNSFAGAAV